jgi:hypothetical protein
MVDRRTEGLPTRTATRVTLTLLVLVVVLGGTPLRSGAGTLPAWRGSGGDGSYTVGNGRHNRNFVSNFSPTNNHGIQHLTNSTVGGNTNTQAGFCKWRFRHCRIKQRIVVGGW